MIGKLISKRGETLAEVLAAVVITVLALSMLAAAISVFAMFKNYTPPESSRGIIRMTFELGDAPPYEADVDVVYNEEGYTYVPN